MNSVNKAVLLLGGSGSRLKPLTNICNKHMLPVGDKPMAQWNLEKIVKLGIKDVLIVSGTHHIGSIIEYFSSGEDFGCDITYKVQNQAGGIAEALKLVSGFVNDEENFLTILGDNIFQDTLHEFLFKIEQTRSFQIGLTSYKVDDPERFGVFQDGKIVEKPKEPKSNQIVAGVYCYKYNHLFRKELNSLKYSERGELEITDLNNRLMCYSGFGLVRHELNGYWTDAGTHESLKFATKISPKL